MSDIEGAQFCVIRDYSTGIQTRFKFADVIAWHLGMACPKPAMDSGGKTSFPVIESKRLLSG